MIKEIMLASALTLSTPPLPHFYDINYVFYRFELNFDEFDYQHYNAYVIDLNAGTSEIGNIYSYSNNTYQLTNTTFWHDTYMKDFQHYLSYIYDNQNPEESININEFLLEWDLSFGSIQNVNTSAEEIVIDCFFAVPGSNDYTLIDVSGPQEIRFSVDSNYAFLYAYNWLDAEAFLEADNAYLVLRADTMEGSEGEDADFEFATYFTDYIDVFIGDNTNYIYGSYSDFIYENVNNWVEYGEELEYEYNLLMREASELVDSNQQLQYENAELTNQNEELERINQELRQENEELNSKHALSSLFEIVRGAIDGVVNFLEIELMPNLTIGTIIFIPVVIGVIFFILKALVL